jgi:hypothetical protein
LLHTSAFFRIFHHATSPREFYFGPFILFFASPAAKKNDRKDGAVATIGSVESSKWLRTQWQRRKARETESASSKGAAVRDRRRRRSKKEETEETREGMGTPYGSS